MPLQINKPPGNVGKASQFDKHLISTPAVGTVSSVKQHKVNGKVESEQTLLDNQETVHPGVVLSAEEMCKVTVTGGQTISLGNYEFARVDVSLMMPCKKDELEETFEFSSNWVGKKIDEAVGKSKG